MKKSFPSLLSISLALSLGLWTANADVAFTNAAAQIPDKIVDAKGKKVSPEATEGKIVALYFSAHWCPPCRAFTPSLVEFRNKHSEEFEIIFVSLDNSNTEKQNYMRQAKMSWLTIPGARSRAANTLAERFSIQGIPSLIVLRPDGSVITTDGRTDVMVDPDSALAKWKNTSKENS